MRRLPVFLLLSALVLPAQEADSPVAGIKQGLEELADITGLRPRKRVESYLIDKPQLKKWLEERIREEVKPEEIRAEELALKKFGLVPESFDLKQTTVDLLLEQAAAFYDHRKKKLFLLEAGSGESQSSMILIHELAHALADQHFDLGKYIEKGRTDDAALARMAVAEGQATWLMLEVMARKTGMSLTKNPEMLMRMGYSSDQMKATYPVLGTSPL
jgi:hypothetical protein